MQTASRILADVPATDQEPIAVTVQQPGHVPLRLLLMGPALEVGRDCRGLVLDDPQISRRHLSLQASGRHVRVTDLGSTNGTLVDGRRIHGEQLVGRGEVVRLGASTIVIWEGDPTSAPDDPRTTSIDLVAAAAAADPPDFGSLAADAGTLTIVFSDIEGSTQSAIELGDARWVAVLETHNAVIRGSVARHGGTEIKAQGDGFMLSFPSARRALLCMVDVQRALHALARSRPADGVRVRVGAHTGEVILGDDGDLFGRHVVIASRIADAARGGEILVSGIVRELVEPRGEFAFGAARSVTLKGFAQNQLVHPVDWQQATEHISQRKGGS